MKYSILILSPIPVSNDGTGFKTLDLWARDLRFQGLFSTVHLICPSSSSTRSETSLDPAITVHPPLQCLSNSQLSKILSLVEVVQLPGNEGWRRSTGARRLLKIAKSCGKTLILGVSSNRAKSAWLNSRNKLVGALRYLDIRSSQVWLAVNVDGVFVVGDGLRSFFERLNSTYVGIASWIEESDIAPIRKEADGPLKLCMASRMEKMKGMHLGVVAASLVQNFGTNLQLLIVGEGPERQHIEKLVSERGLVNCTKYYATLPYPKPFHELLRGAVAELVGIEVGVVSGVINLESSGVEASDWRLRHEQAYHEARFLAACD